jgi:hypothetical protein
MSLGGAARGAPAQDDDVTAYSDVLVDTLARDLEYPIDSIPAAVVGVLGIRVDRIRKEEAYLAEVKRQAIAEAWRRAAQAARPQAAASPRTSRCNGDFACFKACTLEIESHGNYAAVSPGGTYRGAWQFDQRTWDGAVARAGHPEWSGRDPATAPPAVQDAAAHQLYRERGNQPWGGRC